jgi:hypothetical protein
VIPCGAEYEIEALCFTTVDFAPELQCGKRCFVVRFATTQQPGRDAIRIVQPAFTLERQL